MKKFIVGFSLFLVIVGITVINLAGNKRIYACGTGFFETPCNQDTTYQQEQQAVNQNQLKMLKAVPIPQLQTSQERVNQKRKAELFNDENKLSYIYLVSYGKVMAFYTVKGKVSSLNTYMVPMEKLVDNNGEKCSYSNSSGGCYVVESPDIDGTYGTNPDGIFFFTTEGAYVEWKGDYMMSDQPLKLTTQPELVRQVQ